MDVLIREPKMEDAEALLSYFNELVEERTYIICNRKITLEKEKRWLKEQLEKMRENRLVFVVAETDGKIVGTARLERKEWREDHLAEFGIAVSKDYRGRGIGKLLFHECYARAKELWKDEVKYIILSVFENNHIARRFYETLGFKEVARVPNAIRWNDGTLIAQVIMMREF